MHSLEHLDRFMQAETSLYPNRCFHVDARRLHKGDVWVCLNASASQYTCVALARGCGAIIAETGVLPEDLPTDIPWFQVDKGALTTFLQAYAAKVRRRWQGKTVIGITGSVGKSSTTALVRQILSNHSGKKVYASPSNWNGQWGAALSILNAPKASNIVVIELGIDAPGAMRALGHMLMPDIGLITNIHPVHLDGLGSIEGIASEKAELFSALGDNGIAVINADAHNAEVLVQAACAKRRVFFAQDTPVADGLWISEKFSSDQGLSFRVSASDSDKSTLFTLETFAKQAYENMLAALSVAKLCGVVVEEVAESLHALPSVPGRMQKIVLANGTVMLDDTFNCSPVAMRGALDTLSSMTREKKSICVFADMLELKDQACFWHEEVALWASSCVDLLLTLGSLSKHTHRKFEGEKEHLATVEALIARLQLELEKNLDVVMLLKGSRSMRLDQVVSALMAKYPHKSKELVDV